MIRLPLTSDPHRTFTITVNEVRYAITQKWNDRSSVWTLDIATASDEEPVAYGIAVVLGANLFENFAPALGELYVIDNSGSGIDAGQDDLGTRIDVIWVLPGEVVDA